MLGEGPGQGLGRLPVEHVSDPLEDEGVFRALSQGAQALCLVGAIGDPWNRG